MKKNKVILNLSISFFIAIMASWAADTSFGHEFFGQTICSGNVPGGDYYCSDGGNGIHRPDYHWNYRRFLFFIAGFILFIVNVLFLINEKDESTG
jgi:hypothetical protein